MYRHWLWLLALIALVALFAITACSSDPVNEPPRVDLVYPDNGFHYTSSPDSMVANATDDRGVVRLDQQQKRRHRISSGPIPAPACRHQRHQYSQPSFRSPTGVS